MYCRFQLAPDRQKGSDKIHETTRFFCLAWCFCLGRRRRVLRTLIRTAPDSQEGQKKSHLSQNFAPDSQKGSHKIRETTRFFGSALRFCWVGGVECYELFYVRHLTVRRVKIKATCRFCWVGGVECYELFYVRHLTVRRVKIRRCRATGVAKLACYPGCCRCRRPPPSRCFLKVALKNDALACISEHFCILRISNLEKSEFSLKPFILLVFWRFLVILGGSKNRQKTREIHQKVTGRERRSSGTVFGPFLKHFSPISKRKTL